MWTAQMTWRILSGWPTIRSERVQRATEWMANESVFTSSGFPVIINAHVYGRVALNANEGIGAA